MNIPKMNDVKELTQMARQKLTGIYIPVVTPFNEDESINFAAIDEVAKFLAENGVDGIIPSDSNGDVLWLQMIKIGLKMRGVNAGYCRKPVINGLPQEDMDRLTAALKHYNYI